MPSISSIRADIATPDKKRRYNHGLFSRVADEYDLATRAMSLGRDQAWKRALIGMLPPMKAPNCVDLASGTGDVAAALSRRFPNGRVVGIDLTPAMLEVARERCPWLNVEFRVADMCRTGLPDEWADIVTGSYALRNAPTLEDALVEINRILRPGGCAAFLDFCKPSERWRQAMQIPLLKAWGAFWGVVIHGGPEHAYIAESLRQFPDRGALRKIFSAHGFHLESSRPCFGGMLEILVFKKAERQAHAEH